MTILGAHAWSFMIFWTGSLDEQLKPLFHVTESLFHGSTLYFAIISGLLFSKILHTKSWGKFYKGKFNNVLLPYVCMTLFYTLLFWQGTVRYLTENGQEANFVLILLGNIAGGNAAIHLWYIPVLAFLFAMTPALNWLMHKQFWLLVAMAAAPLVISRSPFPNFLEPQSFVYFLGAYALGMLMGNHLEVITQKARRYRVWLLVGATSLTGGIYYLFYSGYQNESFYSAIQTLVYVQKGLIFLFLIQWLETLKDSLPKSLLRLGDHAFSIFFLHLFTMGGFIQLVSKMAASNRDPFIIFALGCASLVVTIATSMLLAWLVQLIFKQHSRKLVGA